MNPSNIGARGGNAIIPLVPNFDTKQLPKVKLTRMVTPGGGAAAQKREFHCIQLVDDLDPELILRQICDFCRGMVAGQLGLTTGASRFEYYPLTLAGTNYDQWEICAANQAGTTLNDFDNANKSRRFETSPTPIEIIFQEETQIISSR